MGASIVPMTAEQEYVGCAEVAEILGVSKQRVSQLSRRPDFPSPFGAIRAAKFWRKADIEAYGLGRRRVPGRVPRG